MSKPLAGSFVLSSKSYEGIKAPFKMIRTNLEIAVKYNDVGCLNESSNVVNMTLSLLEKLEEQMMVIAKLTNRKQDVLPSPPESVVNISQRKKTNYIHNVVSGGLNVLVVDKDQKFLSDMENLLSPSSLNRKDVQITFCQSPVEAIINIEEKYYDLIFFDNEMNDLSGHQLVKFVNEFDNACKESSLYITTSDRNIPEDLKENLVSLSDGLILKDRVSVELKNILRAISITAVKG